MNDTARVITTKKRYTAFDIALLAGVSQPTVSRALNGDKSVTEDTRARIKEIALNLGYHVDLRARRLRSQQTGAIALLLCDRGQAFLNPFLLSIIDGITRACAAQHYDLLLSYQPCNPDAFIEVVRSRKADGIIVLGHDDFKTINTQLAALEQQGTPFIRWGAERPQQAGVSVGTNNRVATRRMTEHLIAQGRRRIAFLGNNSDQSPEFQDRYLGFRDALTAANLVCSAQRILRPKQNSANAVTQVTERLLSRHIACDAIVASCDAYALQAIQCLSTAGVNVPNDIAITGFDDIALAALSNPALTTVRQNAEQAGNVLVSNLLDLVQGKQIDNIELDGEIVIRRSCGSTQLEHKTANVQALNRACAA